MYALFDMDRLPDWILLLVLPFKILYYFLEALIFAVIPDILRKKESFFGKIVVITGGGNGIGRCLALRLGKLGVKVVIWDIDLTQAEVVKTEILNAGGEAYAYRCDISDRYEVCRVADLVRKDIGDPFGLINNAGIVNGMTIMELPDERIENLFRVNALASFWTVKAFLPHMLNQNSGHIVTISSVAGYAGICKMGDYCGSKAAMNSFHETLTLEILASGKPGVCTTLVCPYLVHTGLFQGAKSRFPRLIPVVEPDYLAERIVRSMQLKERHLILPAVMRFLLPVYRVLPRKVLESSDDIFGMYSCMDEFQSTSYSHSIP
ncbi:hypothetical protein RvY_15412 [Ramazzottius varieornatus]|uniref:Short-chain dehydrogenase/reductase 3 n=1 Tax=Ramazzottius varieornatus TaxID=947166 RepID=A0A1D1W2U5_RAMVA|nr:hypothetical protein RvY_15412 [Ramazzottius varieornatus]